MKKSTSPKRPTTSSPYKSKILPLAHLINSLLSAPSGQFYPTESSPQKCNIQSSRLDITRNYENRVSMRPQSSRNGRQRQRGKKGSEEIGIVGSPERGNLRPKSSQYPARANYEDTPKELGIEVMRAGKCQSARNYGSVSYKQQLKIEYKLMNAENALTRVPNKAPKSIQSSKPIGLVRGYGVNSHKFHQGTQLCEGRILIIANLTKTTRPQAITSLYAIFQSNKSVIFLDYVREQFQTQISKKLQAFPPPQITKQLIQFCLLRVQNRFCQMYNVPIKKNSALSSSITNSYGLSYSMIFIRNHEITICTKGVTHVKNSMDFGGKMQGQSSQGLYVRHLGGDEIGALDFIVLISEGMHSYRKDLLNSHEPDQDTHYTPKKTHESAWLQRQIWQLLLTSISTRSEQKNSPQLRPTFSIHELMGNTLDSLYATMSGTPSCKNISMVLLCFRNVEGLLEEDGDLGLPYCGEGLGIGLGGEKDSSNMVQNL